MTRASSGGVCSKPSTKPRRGAATIELLTAERSSDEILLVPPGQVTRYRTTEQRMVAAPEPEPEDDNAG